mgnify:CR=1 FL=1
MSSTDNKSVEVVWLANLLPKVLLELLLSFLLTPTFMDAILSGTDSRLRLNGVWILDILFLAEEKHDVPHLFGFVICPNPSIIWDNVQFYSDMAVISVNGENETITVKNGCVGKYNPNPAISFCLYYDFNTFMQRTFNLPHHSVVLESVGKTHQTYVTKQVFNKKEFKCDMCGLLEFTRSS